MGNGALSLPKCLDGESEAQKKALQGRNTTVR